MVIPPIASDERIKRLKQRIAECGNTLVHVSGVWGSSAPMLAAMLASGSRRTFLYVTAHLEGADNARDDLELFLGRPCELFPAWESLPGEGVASAEIEAERLALCSRLRGRSNQIANRPGSGGDASQELRPPQESCSPQELVVVTPIQALMQPVPTPEALERNTLRLTTNPSSRSARRISPDDVLEWAIARGFERLDLVESPGDVARRGEIVDLFAPGETAPYRFQFDGDEIESIRRFDVSTQRSIETLEVVAVCGISKMGGSSPRESTDFLSYVPQDTLIVLDRPLEIQEMGETFRTRLGETRRLLEVSAVLSRFADRPQLFLSRFAGPVVDGEDHFEFDVGSLTRFEGSANDAVGELVALAAGHEVYVLCDNDGERQRLGEMLAEQAGQVVESIHLEVGVMHRGFVWSRTKTAVVAHHEIFHRHRQRRRIRRVEAGRPIDSWTDLKPGEHVVHVVHGIALYRGLHVMQKGESVGEGATCQEEEFLTLEFADGAVVHAPCSQIDLVQKYIGAGGRKPQLSTLGGKRWNKTKQKVAESVSELAEALLRVQAVRAQAEGTAYPPDTEWQREFEASFLYEETEDQLLVAAEIREDLCRGRPMDRLVCGDVGYGKTELAMRSAFKVIEFGRQVALLVPTTVLAEQHYETFRERMADYPFSIGCLSRFRSPSEQKILVEQVKRGQVDIVIGTHRLLSKDIAFASLGLVIIDEEQRFGVEHKERLRAMRETVDVLTLTATPIPRTLHLSLLGVRDISSLQTPPVDRRSIATQVRPFDRSLIRDAVLREMNRDGQVYFIHNLVQSIAAMADTIRSIVPEARVVFAHGQMKDGELEGVMRCFHRREADVLVATTIIESGIDIPTVNTIFINRAERFGLADLHQLRGRVGRSSHRAYCYLLLSPDRPPTGKAAKRLKTIEEFSELGAGFRIAMRDLEIRGAGNLLGREQSGHIAAVGYEMYCRLVEQTVRRLKNEPDPSPRPVQIDLDVAAHVPTHYASSERARMEIYRRVVACRTREDLEQVEKDLIDAFGPLPQPLQRMLDLAELRVLARAFGILSISLRPPDVIFVVEKLPAAEALFKDAPGSVRLPDDHTVHLRLAPSYLEPTTLVALLRRMMLRASPAGGASSNVEVLQES
ncbi:MAG: transcription-repair coupling factor [Planctomycetes bacterium]|nr:transcription-repair coupling factor [Planctomycetota bacterium]